METGETSQPRVSQPIDGAQAGASAPRANETLSTWISIVDRNGSTKIKPKFHARFSANQGPCLLISADTMQLLT